MRACTLLLACVQVHAPLSKVFEVWRERSNYVEWFDLIGQVIVIASIAALLLTWPPVCTWKSALPPRLTDHQQLL